MAVSAKEPKKSKGKTTKPKPKTSSKSAISEAQAAPIPLPVEPFCSFCGKPSNLARFLIAGPRYVFICTDCLEVCNAILLDVDNTDKTDFWRNRMLSTLSNPKKYKIDNTKKTKQKGKKQRKQVEK